MVMVFQRKPISSYAASNDLTLIELQLLHWSWICIHDTMF